MQLPQYTRRHWLPSGIILFWLLLIMPLYLPNMGGSGLTLPQNIISWSAMAATVTAIWLTLPAGRTVHLTTTACGLLFGIVILGIPLLYTSSPWHDVAVARWLGLLGGWVFYLSLLQCNRPRFCRYWLYYAILAATAFQAFIALLQFTVPTMIPAWFAYPVLHGRAYGVFQQANVLASFIATGMALTLMLFLLPGFTCSKGRHERLRTRGLGLLLVLFPVVLVWLQSRIGWLTGAAVALLFLCRYRHVAPRRTKQAAGLISAGLLIGVTALLQGFYAEDGLRYVSHDFSNHARYTMLRDTLAMIGQKPLFGWGYGGFEYSFQHFRLAQTPPTAITEIARHPHNELLLWWVEGGLVALAGMLLLLGYGLNLVRAALKQDRANSRISKHPAGEASALCIVLLPMLLHTQTEYPFILSTAHWAIFLLLLAQLDRLTSGVTERRSLSAPTSAFLGGMIPALSIATLLLAGCGLYANLALTTVERNHLANIEPARTAMKYDLWVNSERWHYDQQTHALLAFNQTRDPALLDGYVRWAHDYLSRRVDKNVYASWLAIAQYRQDAQTHHKLRQEAHSLFPNDERFLAPFIPQQRPEAVL
ncbi:O-antigen ligase C-terminal domain-containing protein [Serratia entomophila]|uniref:O-antigen ligase C-terminal domain-containing protein n=3 Tax=Serratia TaxID=613 RepID=A0ABY5D0E7_9GAMM|nr:O-antigen ligase C-terminal domain-containing protein [Serratia plymuthica]USV03185.1 O-antigen ligase C-terminal domain-containing protein [Serratia entomophila]